MRPLKLDLTKEQLENRLKIYSLKEAARAEEVSYATFRRLAIKYGLIKVKTRQ